MRTRGRHTVLLGMAPGVGKTYRALDDLRRARDAGRDAVVALVETHGRAETAARIGDLEVLPRRGVVHGGIVQAELDVDVLLARAPEVALIDELAHTNVSGCLRAKRWEDVEDVLDAGIDVISTVNVQHLESLNDQITELTGVRVRETVPDRVLVAAADVAIVDLPPEVLLQRLRDGQVYPLERVPAALNHFFRIEHLTALRETALLQAAEEVGARRSQAQDVRIRHRDRDTGGGRPSIGGDVPDAVQERILALVSAGPSGQRVLRRAWRSARRLHATLEVLHVRRPGRPPDADERERIAGITSLARLLGSELWIEEADDIVAVLRRIVAERGTTYVVLGAPRVRRGWRRLGASLPDRLLRGVPGVDLRIVADRRRGREAAGARRSGGGAR